MTKNKKRGFLKKIGFSDREKLLQFENEGREFANFLKITRNSSIYNILRLDAGSFLLEVSQIRFKSTLLAWKLDIVIGIWWFQFWKCFSTLTILGKHLDDGQTEVNGHYPLALFLLLSCSIHSELISFIMAKAETEKKSQFENVLFFFWYLHLGNNLVKLWVYLSLRIGRK